MLTVKRRAVGFLEVSVVRDTLQLPPGFAAGMTVRPDVAASLPAAVQTVTIRTEVTLRVDCATPPPMNVNKGGGDKEVGCWGSAAC